MSTIFTETTLLLLLTKSIWETRKHEAALALACNIGISTHTLISEIHISKKLFHSLLVVLLWRRVPKTYVGSIQIFFLVVMQFCAGCWKNSSPHQRNVIWILWVLLDWCRTMVYTSGIRAVKSSKGQFDIYKMPGKLCMKQSGFFFNAAPAPFLTLELLPNTVFFKHCIHVPIWKNSEPWLIWKGEISLLPKQFLGGWEKKKPQQLSKCKLYFVFH